MAAFHSGGAMAKWLEQQTYNYESMNVVGLITICLFNYKFHSLALRACTTFGKSLYEFHRLALMACIAFEKSL